MSDVISSSRYRQEVKGHSGFSVWHSAGDLRHVASIRVYISRS
jgi:hypothetical protein